MPGRLPGFKLSSETKRKMSLAQLDFHRRERGGRYFNPKNPPITKVCSKCNKRKLRSRFSKSECRYDKVNAWCKKCMRRISKKYLKSKSKESRLARAALRLEVLQHYSGKEIPECACCGVHILEFLSIDHIKGGGSKHKKTVRHVYLWLRKKGFPKGFRVLCHNCNQSLGAYGYCPHDRVK
jgi:hypothetical protein